MQSFRTRVEGFALLLAIVLLSVAPALAQTTYGAIRGLVKDPQGAVLVGADVNLTNEAKKVTRTTKTTGSGEYNFTAVDPGSYTVSVVLTGFKTTENKGIVVETGTTSTADLALSIGGSAETVEVSTAEPLIDTANGNGGQAYTAQQLTELPNLGRNPFVFEKLDVAVTATGDPRFVRAEDQTGQSTVSVSGAPIGANNYAVDGIPISRSNGGVTFIPSLEAVSDVKVQANTYDAEVGRTGGGLFNTTLKSGSDSYHGVLYGVTRQTNWSANSYANNNTAYIVNGVKIANQTPRPDVTTYLYAGAFGGPLPFSDKSKFLKNTFFWIVEEGYRQAQPLTGTQNPQLVVPTPAELTGDFSQDNGVSLFDPQTTMTSAGVTTRGKGMITGTPIAAPGGTVNTAGGTVIPTAYLNPIGVAIASAYAPCNFNCGNAALARGAGVGGSSGGTTNDFATDDFKTRSDMYSGKLDHVFTPWWSAAISYVHLATQEPSGSFLHTPDNADGILHRFNDATAYNNVFQINPTTVATVGYGFNRYYSHQVPYSFSASGPGGFNQGPTGLGFPAAYAALVQSKTFPVIAVTGVGPTGSSTLGQTSSSSSNSLGAADGGPTIESSHNLIVGVSKTVGKQNLKAGYVYRALSAFTQPLGNSGTFSFNGSFSSANGGSPSAAQGGSGLADLLMGLPGGTNATGGGAEGITEVSALNGSFNQTIKYHALFLQDDFRVTDRLTVNAGIRYEYELGQRDANNQFAVGFDPNAAPTFTCLAAPCATYKGGLVYAGQNGAPTRANDFSHGKFSPRLGFAYDLHRGTVVRGGFGIFYAPVALASNTQGYTSTTSLVTSSTVAVTPGPAAPLSSPFASSAAAQPAILPPSGNTLGALTGAGGSLTSAVQDFKRRYPLVEQYSLNVQHQLPYGFSVELGYIGEHSKYLPQNVSVNQLPDGLLSQYASGSIPAPTSKTHNTYNSPAFVANGVSYPSTGQLAQATVYPGQLALPFPQFNGNGVLLTESVGYSLYNAMTVKVQKRYHGLNILSTYTWSSNWDNFYAAAGNFTDSLNTSNGPQDYYNTKGEYARAVNDIPNRLTVSINYDIPVGRGKQFFGNMPKWVDLVAGGYTINSVSIEQNGAPLEIVQSNISASSNVGGVTGFGGSVQRPTLIPGMNPCFTGRPSARYNNYFNTAAFAATPAFAYSKLARSVPCQGPGYANTDLSINKTFTIKDRVKIEFRAEALNATNTTEFSAPGVSFTAAQTSLTTAPTLTRSSSTAILAGQAGFSREIQLGGRLSF